MMKPQPIIKFNGGAPVVLCNRCYIIMCYVTYAGEDKGVDGYVVSEAKCDHFGDICTNAEKGDNPPLYCKKCNDLLNYSVNE